MRYATLLLDFDHTLFDSDASEEAAFEAALGSAGIDDPSRHRATYTAINDALWKRVELGEIGVEDVRVTRFERLLRALDVDADAEAVADVFTDGLGRYGELYPSARGVLDALRSRARLALVTNGLLEVQRSRIERLGLTPVFDAVIISSEVGAAKPAPAIFDATFAALDGATKDGALMIGDSLTSDMRGGLDYGIDTCWYNPHGKPAGPARPHHEIRHLDEIVPLAAGR